MLTRFLSGDYTRGSWIFESGFSGLTITLLVWVGRFYYMLLPLPGLSPVRYAAAKRRV
ncbi:MAG: hypothetical protein KGQ50_07735 [Bacteroidetes bacterium]|nr:hypothetical protein [Bacteroidota bacterium]